MRRTVLVLSAILLASFGISYAKPNSTQEKPGTAEPKITPEDAARKNPVPPTSEGLAEVRKLFGYNCAMCHGKSGDGKGDLAADMKLELRDWRDARRRRVKRCQIPFDPLRPQFLDTDWRRRGTRDFIALCYARLEAFPEGVFRWPTRHNF